MGFWDRFKRQQQKSRAHSVVVQWALGQPVWSGTDYDALAKEGYAQNVYVFACIHQIAVACGGIPWGVFRKQRDGTLDEVADSPLRKLLTRPNPSHGWSRFLETAVSYLLLAGNSYIEAVGPERGAPRELYTLPPARMKVVPGDSQHLVRHYEYEVTSRKVIFPPETILHLKLFNPLHDWYGLSPIQVAARSVDQNNESRKWNVALLQNSGRPPGALKTETNLTQLQFDQLEKMIADRFSGITNAGRPLVLEGGLTWQEMGMSPADMHWLEGVKLSAREIAIAFGVPPELIGDTANKTYSNYKEARQAFYAETVLPLMDWLRDELNAWIAPKFGENLVIDYLRDDIEALQEERAAVWSRTIEGVRAGILTANEARQLLGYDAVPGADMLMIPGNLIPLATVGGADYEDDGEG